MKLVNSQYADIDDHAKLPAVITSLDSTLYIKVATRDVIAVRRLCSRMFSCIFCDLINNMYMNSFRYLTDENESLGDRVIYACHY